jgi:hypothetical protein
MEYENNHKEYASKGVSGAALGIGIGALGLEVLRGGLGGILGGNSNNPDGVPVSRYEAAQASRIAQLETEVKLRDSNIYTDQKILELYRYVDGKLDGVNAAICAQNVYNATNSAAINCINSQIAQLMALTKVVIPADNICPQPMPQYNSWTAPTAAA